MRNLKKVLSVLLVVAMLVASMVPAFAAETFTYSAQAKALYDLKLFNGVSATEFAPDLGASLTREQGFALILRILGKGEAAKALTAADVDAALKAFGDAKDVEPTLKNEVALAVKLGLVKGDGKNVDAKGAMLGKDFATVLLRQLGYADTEFAYDTAAADLAAKGGLTTAEATKFNTKALIRDDLVGMAYGSLQAKYKTGETVVAKLITDKVVTEAAATAAGVYKPAAVAAAVTVKATGAKQLTVSFDAAIDTAKATYTVKKGSIAYSVDTTVPSADKKSVVINMVSKLTEGDYSVTVAGVAAKDLTATVTATDEKVDKITFATDKAILTAAGSSYVYTYAKFYNQYKEDVTTSYANSSYVTVTAGASTPTITKEGKITIYSGGTAYVYGNQVAVAVVYSNGANVATANQVLTVANSAGAGEIAISKLYNDSNKTLKTSSDFTGFYLILDVKDQYGNLLTDKDIDLLKGDLVVSSSNNTVVSTAVVSGTTKPDITTITINGETKLALQLVKPSSNLSGTAIITAVSTTTGKMAQYTVEVKDSAYAASFTMSAPDVAVVGEKTVIPFTAYDVDGNEITDVADLQLETFKSATEAVAGGLTGAKYYVRQNTVKNKPELVLDTTASTSDLANDTTVTLTVMTTKTYKTSTINVKVSKETAKPTQITSVAAASSFYRKIAEGAVINFNYDRLTYKDQYSRDIIAGTMRNKYLADTTIASTPTKIKDAAGNDVTYNFADTLTNKNQNSYRLAIGSDNGNVAVVGEQSFVDAAGDVGPAGNTVAYIGQGVDKVYLVGNKVGTSTITAQLQQYVSGTWKNISDAKITFTESTVSRDDITSFAMNTLTTKVFEVPNYNYTDTTLNNGASSYDSGAVQFDGVTSDGSKVWVSQQILVNGTNGAVNGTPINAYNVIPGYSSKLAYGPNGSVYDTQLPAAGTLPNANAGQTVTTSNITSSLAKLAVKEKFRVTSALITGDDTEITVPYAVSVADATYFKKATTTTLSGTFVVAKALPVVTTLTLVDNGVARLSSDAQSLSVDAVDVQAIRDAYTAIGFTAYTENDVIDRIVADGVKTVDQYGKEYSNEYKNTNHKNANTDTYVTPIAPTANNLPNMFDRNYIIKDKNGVVTGTLASGCTVDVTVISKSGAVFKTFKISIN